MDDRRGFYTLPFNQVIPLYCMIFIKLKFMDLVKNINDRYRIYNILFMKLTTVLELNISNKGELRTIIR